MVIKADSLLLEDTETDTSEVLEDTGVYFNPEVASSIANAVRILIEDDELRETSRIKSKALSENYSWQRCATETWSFLSETFDEVESLKNV